MTKLDPEFKKKWVEALRSGEYKQGRLVLRNNRGQYCCLGVACKVSGIATLIGAYINEDYTSDHPELIPISTRHNDGSASTELTSMNDSGKTFAEIADWIEVNL